MSHLLFAVLLACTPDPGAGKVAAKVEAPPAPAAAPAPAPAVAGQPFKIDVARSRVEAVGAKLTGSHTLTFGTWTGSAAMTADKLSGLEVEVDLMSLNTDSAKLVKHLQSADFFDAATFPKATFKAAEITGPGADGAFTVAGDLTMRGTSKRITFPATISVNAGELKADASFAINRKDFGIVYPGKPDDLIADNVALTVSLVATPG